MILALLKEKFEEAKSQEIAKKQQAYMRDLFPFLGIPSPIRKSLQKEVFAYCRALSEEHLHQVALELYEQDAREYQYAALDYLVCHQKLCTSQSLAFFEKLIRTKSWWDTVDGIGPILCGKLILHSPDLVETMKQWNQDPDLWIRRTSILYQLKWKNKTSENILFSHILNLASEKDFFIRKAIGWSLREYAKTSPQAVFDFVQQNKHVLSNLSVKEALKHSLI